MATIAGLSNEEEIVSQLKPTEEIANVDSTSSGECLPPSMDGETNDEMPTKPKIPEIQLPLKDPPHSIVCREWKTESIALPQEAPPAVSSTIPEKDAVLWLIKDFSAFRSAAKVSQIPPLVSPEFGGGCRLRLWLYEKKGHIVGSVELPMVKATRDGVAHFRITVVKPDLKLVTMRKVEMRVAGGSDKKLVTQQKTSANFRLTKARCMGGPKLDHFAFGDCLRIRVEFEYFPFDAPIFRGFGRTMNNDNGRRYSSCPPETHSELLNDIRNFCKDDPSQNVEIRTDDSIFNACRFLLCSRSKRFREIFGNGAPLSARGSPSRFGPFTRTASMTGSPISSVTVQDIAADTLDQILSFIHSDTCPWMEDKATDILKALELFEAADLYGIEALVSRLTEYLGERMDRDNFMYMYDVSERCNVTEFKRLCTEYMDSFPGSQVASLIRINSVVPSPRA